MLLPTGTAKPITRQKTTWAGAALIITGIFQIVGGDITTGSASIATGLGLIFLRNKTD